METQMSGREFLDSMHNKDERMGLACERGGGTFHERHVLDIADARRGEFRPHGQEPSPSDVSDLELLSNVVALRQVVNSYIGRVSDLERMVCFLVERVPGPPAEPANKE